MSNQFQSTHSLRSATSGAIGRRPVPAVSIHALLAECDRGIMDTGESWIPFQSTHSLRSATHHSTWEIVLHRVSIHALLAECDRCPAPGKRKQP